MKRESTRLSCVAASGGQATLDLDWWMKNIPGYAEPHRDHRESFGVETKEELKPLLEEYSVIHHVTADDPPIFMSYLQHPDDPVPEDPARARSWKVHHVTFGIVLKKKLESLGIEADLHYPGAETTYRWIGDFFVNKLLPRG